MQCDQCVRIAVPFVQLPSIHNRNIHEIRLLKSVPQSADRSLQVRCISNIEDIACIRMLTGIHLSDIDSGTSKNITRNNVALWKVQDRPSFFRRAPAAAASMLPFSDSGQSYLHKIFVSSHQSNENLDDWSEMDAKFEISFSFSWNYAHHPVNLFSLFHVDSPCLTKTRVYLLRDDVSLFAPLLAFLISWEADLRTNMVMLLRDVDDAQAFLK